MTYERSLLNELSGEKKFHPLKMLKLRKSLNKISKTIVQLKLLISYSFLSPKPTLITYF